MVEGRHRARFLLEAPEAREVVGQLRRQELDRHEPIEPRILREVHFAHAAGSQAREDAVVGDRAGDHSD
jgi:hypothetical protein